ncbi:MAG: 3-methyl-2-oxobutanoate hydroxymethyltransferase [Candidatus Kapaibacteriales bacterium]
MSYAKQSSFKDRAVTTLRLQEMKNAGIKISCLTAYDFTTAKILDEAGIDLILVGDSLGNIVQGNETTISVSLEDTIYHTKYVAKACQRALVVGDMPFMTYQVSSNEAFRNAGKLMKETGCHAVKLEGAGDVVIDAVKRMTESGIPVMGHLGLTPQSINQFGSYRARGRDKDEATKIMEDSLKLQEAGAFAVTLEKIPAELGSKITEALEIPTIGIGAGSNCDGQILVYTDMLGITKDFSPRFVRRYVDLSDTISDAIKRYSDDVRKGTFPNESESY